MTHPQIKYYPVSNADTTLITLKDDTTILVDCYIRESAKGDTNKDQFDVKADLLKSLKKRNGSPFVDVFILTHGDEDHCLGFTKNFYQGDPKKYGDANKKAEEIMMDVLWFSPMALEVATNDDEANFKKEAKRRIKLHNDKSPDKDLPGNRIVIIGYDGKEILEDLDTVRKIPGDVITRFNDKEQDLFSIFIHAPFKEQLKSSEKDKNFTSIVFQARFKCKKEDTKFSCLAMFGGDADHYAWEMIYNKTIKHKNTEALSWDIFLAPHHCSWTYFNDHPQKDNPTPKEHSLKILGYKRTNAQIIASCKEIINNDDNPPHFKAKEQYVKQVTKDKFHNTEIYKKIDKTPQPIIFEMTCQGPMPPKEEESNTKSAGAAGLGAVNNTSSYG